MCLRPGVCWLTRWVPRARGQTTRRSLNRNSLHSTSRRPPFSNMGRKAKPTAALDINTLPELFAPIFHQAQFSSANHRKNVVALHKIHVQAAEVTKPVEDGPGIQLIGEGAFNKTFVSMLNHILPMKKGVTQADKLVKFVAAFLRYTSEKGMHSPWYIMETYLTSL